MVGAKTRNDIGSGTTLILGTKKELVRQAEKNSSKHTMSIIMIALG